MQRRGTFVRFACSGAAVACPSRQTLGRKMPQFEVEGEWLASLPANSKLLFLALLSHALTVAGRNSYQAQTEELEKPAQLRRVNEIQHRVSACLRELLTGQSSISFQQSIATWVLEQPDEEFQGLMAWVWCTAKEQLSNAA